MSQAPSRPRRHQWRQARHRCARAASSDRGADASPVAVTRRWPPPAPRIRRRRAHSCPPASWYRGRERPWMDNSASSMSSSATVTPAMRQYLDAKRQYRDAIVFFRMGDFYEMFYEDALVAARALELTLTSRSKDAGGNGIPMCGVPHHAADGYVTRLVKKGFRVAICEQTEDPKKAKGLVKRAVVRVVSPGTLTDANYLEAREPAYLMSIAAAGDLYGVGLIDLSTGEFTTAEYRAGDGLQALADEISVLRPREVVVPSKEIVDRLPEIARL